MKKKSKVLKFAGFTVLALVVAFSLYAISLLFYNPFLAPRMIEYYSNDANYFHYVAIINSCNNVGSLIIENVDTLDEGERAKKDLENIKREGAVRIYSLDIEQTWGLFSPYVGMEFEFIGSFRIFYDGGTGAIVEITVGGNEILDFESGKEALLQWAATVY